MVKRALEWLQQIQTYNMSKTDEHLLQVLQPFLTSAEKILRVQALMAISSSIKGLTSVPGHFVLSIQDMEYLQSQLSHEDDFTSEEVLRLMLSLSCLSQNLRVMRSSKFIDCLSVIFEGKTNVVEQEIAAQLVQIIVESETTSEAVATTEEKVYKCFTVMVIHCLACTIIM